jgi:flagellar L-ring protein precursor FlgH
MSRLNYFFIILLLSGCAAVPPTDIKQPLTARPPVEPPPPADGAIYHVGVAEHPLFEDVKARNVGDTLVINIVENTAAFTKSSSSADHTGTIGVTAASPIGFGVKLNQGASLSGSSSNKFAGDGASSGTNVFTGTIAVTVTEVLSNGNLVVSGEKQIAINQGHEFIRFSGVVNPKMVIGNAISSTEVADAKIEYKASGYLNEAQVMGWLQRFFLTFLPF